MQEVNRRYVTQSELKTFKRCRRKWYLSAFRHLGLKREKKYGAAALGTRVHYGLELYYDVGLEEALNTMRADADRDCIMFPEQADRVRKEIDKALAMVEGFVEWASDEGEDEDLEIVGVEERVQVVLPGVEDPQGREVWLLGKLDQRVRRRSTGERMFRDWKTVDDFSRVAILPLDEQMMHYHLLERLLAPQGERTGGALYTMLRKVKRTGTAKPPFFMNVELRHNDQTLRSYWRRVCGTVTDLLGVEAKLVADGDPLALAYPNATRDCSWDCDFFPVCGMFDDGSDAEGILETLYVSSDYLSRYSESSATEEHNK